MRNKLSFSRLNSSSSAKSPKSPAKKTDNFKFEEEKPEREPLMPAAIVAAAALEDKLEGDRSKPEVVEVEVDQSRAAEKDLQTANDDSQPPSASPNEAAATVVEL